MHLSHYKDWTQWYKFKTIKHKIAYDKKWKKATRNKIKIKDRKLDNTDKKEVMAKIAIQTKSVRIIRTEFYVYWKSAYLIKKFLNLIMRICVFIQRDSIQGSECSYWYLYFFPLQSPYAQLLAATTLTKVISRSGTMIPIQDRVEIRNYILNYFATRPKLEPYVQQALMLVSLWS